MSSLHPFVLPLAERIDLAASLEGFRRPGDDLMDRFDGTRLIRTVPTLAGFVPYICLLRPGGHDRVEVLTRTSDEAALAEPLVRRLFVTVGNDWERLLADDIVLARLDHSHPGIRQVLQHDLFTALVRSISAQQINLRWASTIRARLAERFGDRYEIGNEFVYSLNVDHIAAADPAEIRAMQFTTRKAESIVALAQEFAEGRLRTESMREMADEEIITRLVQLKGIGLWSAEWILARTLGRARVVAGDLGVRKAVGRAYRDGEMPSEIEVRRLTAHWGESATVAQALVLHAAAVGAT